jgi:cytidylate kinase
MVRLVNGGKAEQLIQRHIRRWELQQLEPLRSEQRELAPRATVTISRQEGCGGEGLAAALARRLDWHVFDRELVDYVAAQAHVRERVIASLDDRSRSGLEEWLRSLIDANYVSAHAYLQHLMSVTLTIAHHGRAILLGRGANLILSPSMAVRVRVIAPLERRVAMVKAGLQLDDRAARQHLQRQDAERAAFVRTHFHRDIEDPLLYDLIVNTGDLPIVAAVELICAAIGARFGRLDASPRTPWASA